METIKAAIEKTDLPMRKYSQQSQEVSLYTPQTNQLIIRDTHCELSAYNDNKMSADDGAVAVKKLAVAFPNQSRDFFLLLVERMLSNNFTAQRCADAVNYLIDNFAFKQINIADVIKFDKKRKVYTYGQMLSKLVCNGGTEPTTDSFNQLKINGKIYYYLDNENI